MIYFYYKGVEGMEEKNKSSIGIIIITVIVTLLVLAIAYLLFVRNNDNLSKGKQDSDTNNTQSNSGKLYHIEDGEKFNIYGKTPGEDDDFVNRNMEISFAYPVIDIDSTEIKAINKEIYNQYKNDYELITSLDDFTGCVAIKKDNKYHPGTHIFYDTYKIFETDTYLSVVIISKTYTECAGGDTSYKGYVINKKTKDIMSNSELVKTFNADEKKIIDKYNENADVFGYSKAKTIEDVELFIYENKLSLVIHGNGDSLYKYENGNFIEFN